MVARVNGEEWSRGNSRTIHHRFEDVLAHVSRDETVHPGELFGSGTVDGGCGLELGRFPSDGDLIELEVQGLGVLRNLIVFNRQRSQPHASQGQTCRHRSRCPGPFDLRDRRPRVEPR